jgi:hypothetical protein
MATFKTFEQIDVWQKSRELTRQIYTLTAEGGFAKDFGLKDQQTTVSCDVAEIGRMISGLMSYLRGSGIKGDKIQKG